jgi:hypothetical protein
VVAAGSSSKFICQFDSTRGSTPPLTVIDATEEEIVRAEPDLRELFRGDERVARVLPVPGLPHLCHGGRRGWRRGYFSTPAPLCKSTGLTARSALAPSTPVGDIARQGSRWLRWGLLEAAARANGHGSPGPPASIVSPDSEARSSPRSSRLAPTDWA